jgi:hypothetical protein
VELARAPIPAAQNHVNIGSALQLSQLAKVVAFPPLLHSISSEEHSAVCTRMKKPTDDFFIRDNRNRFITALRTLREAPCKRSLPPQP